MSWGGEGGEGADSFGLRARKEPRNFAAGGRGWATDFDGCGGAPNLRGLSGARAKFTSSEKAGKDHAGEGTGASVNCAAVDGPRKGAEGFRKAAGGGGEWVGFGSGGYLPIWL